MEVSNEYLVGSWTISKSITNFLLVAGCKARIYLVSANEETESIDLSSSKAAPKKPTHKSIHIHKLAIVACPKSHIMKTLLQPNIKLSLNYYKLQPNHEYFIIFKIINFKCHLTRIY
jgi:hypothetical protein